MIEVDTLDRITAVIGERGMGKSLFAKADARAFQFECGGYVIGHSPKGYIGADPDVSFYDSIRALDRGLRRHPERLHFIASGASPENVIDYGRLLAEQSVRSAHRREGIRYLPNRPPPRGLLATPVLIIIDEGTHSDQRKEFRKQDPDPKTVAIDKQLERFLTGARHEHVALTWLIQAPTRRSWLYQEQANRFRVFRYLHEWGANAIRAATSIDSATVERIRTLPRFHHFVFDKEEPQRAHFASIPPP